MAAPGILQHQQSNRTFQSSGTTSSTHTKIKIPIEEAVKADFPPGCKVLCFDEDGFRVGVVKNVMVSISLSSKNTFGTFYEVEMRGLGGNVNSASDHSRTLGIFSSSDLRLTPDCPVEVNSEYFGSVFKFAGGSSGRVSGTILGSFEVPASSCNRCTQAQARQGEFAPPRKFFYSVRVKFHGMQEAVEAHGVPPDQIAVVHSGAPLSDASTILSEGLENFVIGGGSFHENFKENAPSQLNILRTNSVLSPSKKAQRITPEDLHGASQPAFKSNIMGGCFQESYSDAVNVTYNHENRTKSFGNVLASGNRELYDSEAASSYEAMEMIAPRRGRSVSARSPGGQNLRARSRSRTHVYEKAKSTRSASSNKIPIEPRRLKVAISSSSEEDSMIDYFDEGSQSEEEMEHREQKRERSRSVRRNANTPIQANGRSTDDGDEYGHYHDQEQEQGAELESESPASPTPSPRSASRSASRSGSRARSRSRSQSVSRSRSRSQSVSRSRSPSRQSRTNRDIAKYMSEEEAASEVGQAESSYVENSGERSPSPTRSRDSRQEQSRNNDETPRAKSKRFFGSSWSPKVDSSGEPIATEGEESKMPSIPVIFSPPKLRESFKTQQKKSVASMSQNITPPLEPGKAPEEGCYLIFDPTSGGKLVIQYSKTKIEGASGFWFPGKGKKLQGFKFKQNQGRSDLVRDMSGKDYKKKYFNGWCQFVKAAKMYDGSICRFSENDRLDLDMYAFYSDSCKVKKIEDKVIFDVSKVDAVSCLPKGNSTFNGVRTGEYGTFINRGDAAGAAMAIGTSK